ncbi:MAG: serine hydrolase [Deltaproteobacteria bacterium]|nr:serine hydrolase [Deltaproteobacteria bacterium]
MITCLLLAFAAGAPGPAAGVPQNPHNALQAVLESVVAQERAALPDDKRHPPDVAAVVVDVSTGVRAAVDGDRPVYLASGMKLFVLIELYRQRNAGTLSFDEQIPFTLQDVRDGSPTMNREPLGSIYTVRQLIKWMVRDSDNAAFDLLLRRATPAAVEAGARRFGPMGAALSALETRYAVYARLDERARALSPVAIRDVRWRDGFDPRLDLLKKHIGGPRGGYGTAELDAAWAAHYATGASSAPLTTPAAALLALSKGEAVSARDDAEILSLLRDVKTSDRRIEGDLPHDVVVAHKTGSLHKRLCDLGLLTLPDGSAVVVVVAVAGASMERAEATVARVTRAAYDVIVEERRVRAR